MKRYTETHTNSEIQMIVDSEKSLKDKADYWEEKYYEAMQRICELEMELEK